MLSTAVTAGQHGHITVPSVTHPQCRYDIQQQLTGGEKKGRTTGKIWFHIFLLTTSNSLLLYFTALLWIDSEQWKQVFPQSVSSTVSSFTPNSCFPFSNNLFFSYLSAIQRGQGIRRCYDIWTNTNKMHVKPPKHSACVHETVDPVVPEELTIWVFYTNITCQGMVKHSNIQLTTNY